MTHLSPWEFDAAARRLMRDGAPVPLEPRAMRLLQVLLERPGTAVPKSEILDAVWPNQIVSEASLTKCVGRLRAAIGDDDHTTIVTLHGHGYRLDPPAPVAAEPVPVEVLASPPPRRWRVPLLALAAAALLLGAGIAGSLSVPSPPRRSANAEANRLYLQGLQDWVQRSPASLGAARREFARAVELDPGFARAHMALAQTWLLLREFATTPDPDAYANAERSARRALALEPDLAGAHAALAFVRFWARDDRAGARQEFDRALMLEPGNATIHHWYATALDHDGDHARALAEIDRAVELEPGSVAIRADRAYLLWIAGRAEEGRAALLSLARSNPEFASTHLYLADLARAAGDTTTFARETATWMRLRQDGQAHP